MTTQHDTRKMVILGHTGLVGGALLSYETHRGTEVQGLSSSDVDLLDRDHLGRLDRWLDPETVLVFCSAVTLDREPDSLQTFDRNLAMASNVGGYLLDHPVAKLVFVSTVSVYGDRATNVTIDESTVSDPTTFYGASKYASETLLSHIAERTGTPYVSLRPCRVYGPGAIHANYGPVQFIRRILAGEPIELYGEGNEVRDQLYVEDLAVATSRLSRGEATGVFNLASGCSHSFREIVAHLRDVADQAFEVRHKPRTRPLIDQQFDISRLRKALPDVRFTPIQEGLQSTYAHFRDHA